MQRKNFAKVVWSMLVTGLAGGAAFAQPAVPTTPRPAMRPAQLGFTPDLVRKKMPAPAVGTPAPPIPQARVHALILGHARDPDIGGGVEISARQLEAMLESAFPNGQLKLRCVGFPSNSNRGPDAADGNPLSHLTIDAAIGALDGDVGANDAIFCFMLAHGAFDSRRATADYEYGHYFGMEQGGSYPRSTLFEKLKARSGRLTVLLSDSCNVKFDLPPVAATVALAAPAAVNRWQALRTLLLEHEGEVSINAASPNQFSFYSPTEGGYFVKAFVESVRSARTDVTWQEFFTIVSAGAQAVFIEGFRPYGGCPYAWDPVGRRVLTLPVNDPRTQKVLQPFATRPLVAVRHMTQQVQGGAPDPCETARQEIDLLKEKLMQAERALQEARNPGE